MTARPRNEWPDDGFQSEDIAGEDEHGDTLAREWDVYYGRGEYWEPAEQTSGQTPGRDGVPTVDDDLDRDPHAAPRSYPCWTKDNSFVVSGTVGPGGRWKSRAEFRRWATEKYGLIFEEYWMPEKVAARVPKPGPSRGEGQ